MPLNLLTSQFFKRSLFCACCFLFLTCMNVSAQKNEAALAFDALTINDGLSQGMVVKMLQDKFGFMWFATLDGLNRYDGYKFTVYRHDTRDTASITNSYAQTLFEDSKGRLWIGTVSGGLDIFDRETETFVHVRKQEKTVDGLAKGAVKVIAEDLHGNIWVQVSDKLDKITVNINDKKPLSEQITVHHVKLPCQSEISLFTLTSSGNIYYADADKAVVYRLDNEVSEKWLSIMRLRDTLATGTAGVVNAYNIVQLTEDTRAKKLLVFHNNGVTTFNEKTGRQETTFQNDFFRNFDTPLRAMLDTAGTLWFSGRGNLLLFSTRTGKLTTATAADKKNTALLHSTYSIYKDRSGLLWIGTAGYGLLKRNLRAEYFHPTAGGANYSVTEADNRHILMGNSTGVHEIFDRQTGLVVDAKELNRDELKRFSKLLFRPVFTNQEGSWFVEGNRFYCKKSVSKEEINYQLPVTGNDEYFDLIQCRLTDPSGQIWLGTASGLLRFNTTNKKWTVFKPTANDPASITGNVILSLCADPVEPAKYLWIGTSGGGLNRMDLLTGKFRSYSIKDGLPNNVVYGILTDEAGNLWISTNKGLSCYNINTQTFRNFDYKDGLQSNEFNRGAYCKTTDGWLFFGGVNGFNYFYPKEISNNSTVPQVVITGLKIRNENVTVQAAHSPLLQAIYLTKKLTLPYAQNFVSFQFAALDFTAPEKNMYRYKLEGFDKNRINSGTVNTATYSNLDPGKYSFSVQASNNDGLWNEQGTSVEVIILPPWYMTWWFRSLLILAVLFAGYLFYKNRLAQALKLQSIRDRIAGDLHDEVGSNLSNIYIFSNVAQHKANAETAPLLKKISDYTRQSMEAMTDIVWMINTRNDRFENIMVRMRTLAVEYAEVADCTLHLNFDERLNDVRLNMEERKNFYLIYKEAINNIAKYAGCKSVWIDMTLDQKTVTLTMRDNGNGFDMQNPGVGNGLYNMQKRASILNGDLQVRSAPGGGTTVTLRFKI